MTAPITTDAGQVRFEGFDPAPYAKVLTADALGFVAALHKRFEPMRQERLAARQARQARLDRGEGWDFLEETQEIREGD